MTETEHSEAWGDMTYARVLVRESRYYEFYVRAIDGQDLFEAASAMLGQLSESDRSAAHMGTDDTDLVDLTPLAELPADPVLTGMDGVWWVKPAARIYGMVATHREGNDYVYEPVEYTVMAEDKMAAAAKVRRWYGKATGLDEADITIAFFNVDDARR